MVVESEIKISVINKESSSSLFQQFLEHKTKNYQHISTKEDLLILDKIPRSIRRRRNIIKSLEEVI